MAREISRVGVVGLGTMGAGIVEVFARNGLAVIAVELDEAAVDRGRGHIETSTGRAVARGKLTEAGQAALLARVSFDTELKALADVDLVIEAVPEQLELKRAIFSALDEICRPDTILATNTSSLSVTEIAVATSRPDKVVGLHFFNPAPVMKLVEVVRSVVTDRKWSPTSRHSCASLGKTDVTIGDRAGFIANALLFGYLNHAAAMYEARYASREDIDAAMKLGCGLPMGPLALLDLIGLDTAFEILDTMYRQSPRPAACADADPQADDHRRPARAEDRPGLLHATTGRIRRPVVADALDASRRTAVTEPRPVRVGGRGRFRARWPPASSRCSPRPASRSLHRPRPEKVAKCRGEPDDRWRRRSSAASSPRTSGTPPWPGSPARPGWRIWPTRDLVVEAVVEQLSVKQALFANLDEICKPGAVLATTTSVAAGDRVRGRHLPAGRRGRHALLQPGHRDVAGRGGQHGGHRPGGRRHRARVCEQIGKHPVSCGDRAGFIVNALLFPYLNDAVKMLEAHYATSEDIDSAMKVGCGYPMGPFELLDVVGLDVSLAIQRVLYLEFREPGFAPAPLLEHLVRAGRLGRKTGKGFREYA